MRTSHSFRSRIVGVAASVACAASVLAASALPAGAQTCPTSGGGTTCFGGQAYCASSGQCYNPPSCTGNQTYNCTACGCVCNTALYPCGGCTAASSTAGTSCSSPIGGRYTNQCGTCACPSGTTICPTSNSCITNRTCPAGTSWDPCTDTCGTPNVLLSPGFQQNGFVQISGELRSTAGNLRLDSATGANQGDIYMANGKAVRVDGAGLTTLSFANFGSGATGLNVNLPTGTQLCFNGTGCRNSWPSSADFNPTYINANGDTMTGDLNLTGATTDLFVAGNLGVGTTTPGSKLDVQLNVAGSSGVNFRNVSSGTGAATFVRVGNDTDNISGLYRNSSTNVTDYAGANSLNLVNTGAYPLGFVTGAALRMVVTPTGDIGIGTAAPGAKLDVAGTAKMTGFQLTTGAVAGRVLTSDASGVGTWQALPASVTGTGTANYLPKFTAASAIGNSQLFDNGTSVGVGTASPDATHKLTVNGSGVSALINRSVGVSNATQWVGTVRLTSTGAIADNFGPTLAFSVAGSGIGPNNIAAITATRQGSDSLGDLRFATGSTLSPQMTISSGGSVGIGTTAPTAKMDVRYSGALGSGNNTAQFYAGTGNYSHVHWGTTGDWYVRSALGTGKVVLQDTGGNVGVGTSNPAYKLEVSSSGDAAYFGSGSSWFKMWTGGNSRLSLGDGNGYEAGFISGGQNGSGENTISVAACQDGGSCPQYLTLNQSGNVGIGDNTPSYDLDVSGSIRATGSIVLGGVSRSSWPSLTQTTQSCSFAAGSAGWKACYCPAGYVVTGQSGYNCEQQGGDWECSATYTYGASAAQFYHDGATTAYVSVFCLRMD